MCECLRTHVYVRAYLSMHAVHAEKRIGDGSVREHFEITYTPGRHVLHSMYHQFKEVITLVNFIMVSVLFGYIFIHLSRFSNQFSNQINSNVTLSQ